MYQARHAIIALAIVVLPSLVDGHGYLKTPRSRNWLAQEDGPGCSNSNPTCPPAEYCPHCLNNNIGVCGKFGSRNYETVNWLNKAGNPMPWVSQYGNTASPSGTFMTTSEYYETEYYEGGLITIDSFLSTHHAGHEEIRACVITDDPSSCTLPEHFPDENELIFVEDLVYDTNQREMFKDPTWPGRGYYSGGEAGGTKEFTHRYRLPDGIVGEKVLLQWKYITANSCKPPGYDDYFQNLESNISSDYSSYWKQSLGDCNWPLNNDGATGSGNPEQFFNCAEITILPSGSPSPTSSNQPSPSPTVSTSPTVSHEPTSQEPTDGPTLSAPPTRSPVSGPPPCVAEYADCTYNESNCCEGYTCTQVDMAGYDKRCLSTCNAPGPTTPKPVGYTSPPTPPFATPTTLKPTNFPLPPSPTEACCTLNLKDCKPNDEYCNSDQQTCEGPCGKLWLPTGPSNGCIPLWGGGCTTDDDCCLHAECRPGGQCESDDPWLQNGDSPMTSSPTVSSAPSHSPTPEPSSAPFTAKPSGSPSIPIPSKSPSPPPSSAPTTKMPSSSPTTRSPTLSFDATYSDKVRVNQIGYLRYATKIGVIVDDSTVSREFQVQDSTGAVLLAGTTSVYGADGASEDHVHQADFTALESLGAYRLVVDGIGSSLEFNIAPNLYPDLPHESMNYFYFHRMGTMDIEAEHLIDGRYARAALHPGDDAVPSYNNWCVGCDDFDLQGSWADAGDFGIYTVNHAISAWTLLNLNEMFPTAFEDGSLNLPESGNGFPDVLDEVDYGSRFVRGMLPSNGGLASHKAHNHAWSAFIITIEDENKENSVGTRSAMGQSTPATYAVARVNAQLARMWSSKGGDPTYVATLWDAAEDAYARATSISEKTYDPSDSPGPAIGGGDYPDGQVSDDKYAAACEMYLTALALGKSNVGTYKADVTSSNHFQEMGQWDWATVAGAGTLSLYAVNNDLSAAQMQTIEDNIVSFANSIATAIETEGYPSNLSFLSILGQYPWGSNSFIMNRMIALAYAYEITGSDTYQLYLMRSMDYVMGTNAMDISYVTGYGEKAETDTHDRWAWTIGQDAFWPKGWLSGGPNNELINDNATPYAAAAKSYAEPGSAPQAWGSKENTINWNAPLAWVSWYIENKVTPNLGGCDGNCKPLAKSFSGKLQMDTSIQLNLEASDYDGSVDTWEIVSSPMFGSLSGDLPNVIYTPNNGAIGTDTFTFTVTDNDGGVSNVATVSLLVRDCDLLEVFQVPAAYPAYSGGYKYVHVSEDGPNLGQMKETAHNVQWTGDQLHQFSLEPDYDPYYKNLPDDCMINQALAGPAASFTLSGCGFNGLDGDYWITSSKDGNEVWVEKNNGWAIVFSNDASYTPEFCRSSSPVTTTTTPGTVVSTTSQGTTTTQAPPDTTTQATQVTTTAETTTIASTTSSTPSPTPLPNQPVAPPSPPPVGGGEVCCTDRNLGYQTCNSNSWCQESPGNCSNCGGVIMAVPLQRTGCCSWSGQDCSNFDPSSNFGCQMVESDCISDCGGTWVPF